LLRNSILSQCSFYQKFAILSLKEKETRERELSALEAAMEELRVDRGTVITLYEREEIRTPAGLIEAVPAWEWFLDGGSG
jgi:predicted AAA+ superfamily ATPase